MLKPFERDFTMKKELDKFTKLNPDIRLDRLRKFLGIIKANEGAKKELENWQFSFSEDVVKVKATALANTTILFKNVRFYIRFAYFFTFLNYKSIFVSYLKELDIEQ